MKTQAVGELKKTASLSARRSIRFFFMKFFLPPLIFSRTGFFFSYANGQRSSFNFFVVQRLHGCLSFGYNIHFNKTKTTALAGFPVHYNFSGSNITKRRKQSS